jgi:hypothetical protein
MSERFFINRETLTATADTIRTCLNASRYSIDPSVDYGNGTLLRNSVTVYSSEWIDADDIDGYLKETDVFVAYDFLADNTGAVVPVIYKTDISEYTEDVVDTNDVYFYQGTAILDGNTYDKWRKIELGGEEFTWQSSQKSYIYTNIIVVDNGIDPVDFPSKIEDVYEAGIQEGFDTVPLQEKTVTPSTSQQTVTPDSDSYGLSKVTVNAMRSGSATTPKTEVPVEEDNIAIVADIPESVDDTGILPDPDNTGSITISVNKEQSVTPKVDPGYVATGTSGKITVKGSTTKKISEILTTQGQTIVMPGTDSILAVKPCRYTTGAITVKGDTNLAKENIKSGVKIFGVEGTYASTTTLTASVGTNMYSSSIKYGNTSGETKSVSLSTSSQEITVLKGALIFVSSKAYQNGYTPSATIEGLKEEYSVVSDDYLTQTTVYSVTGNNPSLTIAPKKIGT